MMTTERLASIRNVAARRDRMSEDEHFAIHDELLAELDRRAMYVSLACNGLTYSSLVNTLDISYDEVSDELKLIANEGFVRSRRLRGLPVRDDGEGEAGT